MRHAVVSLVFVLASGHLTSEARAMQVRALPSTGVISGQLIVGRAHCAGATWLLTDEPELTRVSVDSRHVSSSLLRGLREGEKPWGLACVLPDAELWTLVTPDALARLTPDGHVVERVRLDRPRLGIYTAGERLLLQHPPARVGAALLTGGPPRKPAAFVQWPAPVAQHATSLEKQLRMNLVSCGIGIAADVPCWLAGQSQLAIGDGTRAHTTVQDLRFVRAGPIDESTPIWDVALAGSLRVWVLATARSADGRRVGGRLTRSNRRGADEGFVDLSPPARLILWAAEDRCVLLSSTGQLLEVASP